jgi:hypothetical protein
MITLFCAAPAGCVGSTCRPSQQGARSTTTMPGIRCPVWCQVPRHLGGAEAGDGSVKTCGVQEALNSMRNVSSLGQLLRPPRHSVVWVVSIAYSSSPAPSDTANAAMPSNPSIAVTLPVVDHLGPFLFVGPRPASRLSSQPCRQPATTVHCEDPSIQPSA